MRYDVINLKFGIFDDFWPKKPLFLRYLTVTLTDPLGIQHSRSVVSPEKYKPHHSTVQHLHWPGLGFERSKNNRF